MNIDSILDSLGDEAARSLRGVLKKAYEQGYREGLAASGQVGSAPVLAVGASSAADGPAISATPIDDDSDWLDDVEEDGPATTRVGVDNLPAQIAGPPVSWSDDDDEVKTIAADPLRPISAGATVGTLKARIMKHYALDRFIIDIIVCRKGDKDRRQLKTNVRLSKYVVKG